MKKAKVAISFDDGRSDNVKVIEKLIENRIPSTLFVTTGYVDGTCPKDKRPSSKPAMTVADVVRFCSEPMVEIGLHGDMHLNEDWDIKNGWTKIMEWVGGALADSKYGFASPSTSYPIEKFKMAEDPFFHEQILYLAMGLRITSHSLYRKLARKAGRVIHSQFLYRSAFHDTLMHECKDRVVHRVPVHGDITFEQIKSVVDDAVHSNASVSFMFHSIGVPDGDTWMWDQHKFNQLCLYLMQLRSEDRIDLVKVRDIAGQ